jgi:hypothetical protein
VKQRLCRFDEEKRKVIGEEIHKLLEARFIKEVHHPEWLANPILVKKKSGKWRMCVDYTSLNKACPKVPFPLPRIDQIVDSTAGCETLSFLDAYSGYHQIKMKESDQLATSFITPFGTMHATRFWGTHQTNTMLFFTDIIHRFGVPHCIITDNGTQFTGKKFLDFCDHHHIHVLWSAVAHPKTNGQVECANGMILQGLKPRILDKLNKHGKKWAAELPSVL